MKNWTVKSALFAISSVPLIAAGAAYAGRPIPNVPPPPPVFTLPSLGADAPVFVPPSVSLSVAASPQTTQAIRIDIQAAQDFCRRVPSGEYAIDCLGDAFEKIAQDMPQTGDYAEAQAAIAQAGRKLRALARENASTELPSGVIRSTGADGTASNTPLVPVRTETLAQTNAAALLIIEEAETILLRSAANSAVRKTHYEQIASAVGSNKVLLRSL